ncbi:MAG: hypothetical protein ACE5OY_03610 [Candidatus Bathyarchaeia archaeon]
MNVRDSMQRIVCDNCQHILYEGGELRSPSEIIQEYNGTCPKCGKKLRFNPNSVEFHSSEKGR